MVDPDTENKLLFTFSIICLYSNYVFYSTFVMFSLREESKRHRQSKELAGDSDVSFLLFFLIDFSIMLMNSRRLS